MNLTTHHCSNEFLILLGIWGKKLVILKKKRHWESDVIWNVIAETIDPHTRFENNLTTNYKYSKKMIK